MAIAAARRFEFDGQLAPYPSEHHKVWLDLSKYITAKVLKVSVNVL